jgi:hypothetical protein
MHGTLFPHDTNKTLSQEQVKAKQIDGIIFDPRTGPAVIREGSFLVVHPTFCRGILEIKTSEGSIKGFEDRLQLLYNQYLSQYDFPRSSVMGIVIHDPNPERHSHPDWLPNPPIFHFMDVSLCPIFILFKEIDGEYQPYEPAINAMLQAIFIGSLQWNRGRVWQLPW